MTVRFELVTHIAAPIELLFDLSLDIDTHSASMSPSKERAVGGVTSGSIGLGEQVTWRATHFGIPFTMTSRVIELVRPRRFVDQQVQGPFERFDHLHLFEGTETGTVMTDRVVFAAPFGWIGHIVERAVLGRYLRRLISKRARYLKAEAVRRHDPGSH